MPTIEKTVLEKAPSGEFFRMASDVGNVEVTDDETPEQKTAREKKEQEDLTKQQSNKKDEPAAKLRQQRDNLIKEKEVLEKKILELSSDDRLGPLKKVKEYVEKKYSRFDDSAVDEFITSGKQRKEKLSKLELENQEKEERLKEFNVTFSTDFQENFEKPFREKKEILTATLVPVDGEGQPKNLPLINGLQIELLKTNADGSPKTSLQIKADLAKFSKLYEEKTGETYISPNLETVTNSVRSVHASFAAGIKAKQNWTEEQANKKKKQDYEFSEARKENIRKETEARNQVTTKLARDYDYKSVDGILTEEEIKNKLTEKNNKLIKIYKGEEPAYAYDELLNITAKADQFDIVLEKLKEANKEITRLKKSVRPGLPTRGAPRTLEQQQQVDQEDDDKIETATSTDFFRAAQKKL